MIGGSCGGWVAPSMGLCGGGSCGGWVCAAVDDGSRCRWVYGSHSDNLLSGSVALMMDLSTIVGELQAGAESNAWKMGKKGSWFSAIKRAFMPSPKEKGAEEKTSKEKKKGFRKSRQDKHSFIPLFREPSSIEKILGDAEEHQLINFKPLDAVEQPKALPPAPYRASTVPRPPTSPPRASASSPKAAASPPRTSASTRSIANHLKAFSRSEPPPNATPSFPRVPVTPPPPPKARIATLRKALFTPQAAPPVRSASPGKAASLLEAVSTLPAVRPSKAATPAKELSTPLAVSSVKASTPTKELSTPLAVSSVKAAPPAKELPIPPVASSAKAALSVKSTSPARPASPRVINHKRVESTLRNQHACATKIQTAYRGHVARRSYRALKGLVRLQNVMKGQSVKRQTMSAMKSMQLLVHVQSQIQSRRIQMLENQALQQQALYRNGKDLEKLNMNQTGKWNDSVLTKEEVYARTQRKLDAIARRERAIAYAYSHQVWKATPTASRAALMDIRTGGFPWWWNWLDRRVTSMPSPIPSDSISSKNLHLTPPRSAVDLKASPFSRASNYRESSPGFDNPQTPTTPRSTGSTFSTRNRQSKTPQARMFPQRFRKSRASGADSPFKDNDSLTSCPAFSIPRYMEPTTSAMAKVRGSSPGSSSIESKRRVSLPLAQGIGSFKWGKGSPSGSKESGTPRHFGKSPSVQSTGNLSVDSIVSMPAVIGRKPFNRFV
ncbi:IQ-DOMAIN 13-like protein [Drosera capensis]